MMYTKTKFKKSDICKLARSLKARGGNVFYDFDRIADDNSPMCSLTLFADDELVVEIYSKFTGLKYLQKAFKNPPHGELELDCSSLLSFLEDHALGKNHSVQLLIEYKGKPIEENPNIQITWKS